MEIPRTSAIGLTEWPREFSSRPRRLPLRRRLLAAAILLLFAFAVVSTTVFSAGRYCLTSEGGNTRDLPPLRHGRRP